ncbi:GbsR/MarR family transcriptional regulator [Pleionea litopenaei]|uniref:HTH-type transcriptional regulator n=1 Tax=Pleionea litopenaei TaxID=3070815 RepID=A0AA51RWH0_9GAMM|nr:GbsR/MarR family transcriptional regulator [Pleionea sp. HL-JVS1]WMS88774.1 GbsR/MarR family transcriptional regulator [Pleionea sp. HL-JVS1]
MNIPSDIESFVVHFGEMGSRWGFNRTVGQMLALIVLSENPLNADQIAEMLGVSRGNVSMGLKELQSWQLIRTQPQPGDRKDYFKPSGTIWELALQVLSERRKREVDPTLSVLRSELMNAESDPSNDYAHAKMQEIHDLLELFLRWFDDIQKMNPDNLKTLLKLGSGVGKVLGMKDRLLSRSES